MTTLAITPNWKNKSAKFKGTVAAGEHVSVTIQNNDGEGGEFIDDASTLRLRVVNPCNGRTLAIFPEPVPEGETPETWDADLTPLICMLNLNTVQMLKAVPPAANVSLLFVLDDYDNNTLYFKEQFPVEHWPRLRGEEEPTDLDNYKDIIADFNTRLDGYDTRITGAENAAQAATANASAAAAKANQAVGIANQAVDKAETAQNSAAASAEAAHNSALAADEAQEAAESAAESINSPDATLTEEGVAADAKAAGEAIAAEKERAETAEAAEKARAEGVESGLDTRLTAAEKAIDDEAVLRAAADADLEANKADKSDTYTKTEVDAKIAGVQTFQKYLVNELPDPDEADMKGLYLVPTGETSEEGDLCEEWTVVEDSGEKRWEKIGGTTVDLSDYYDKDAVDDLLDDKQDALTFDNAPTPGSSNPVKSGGIWSAIWGALSALPTGFSSLYDWCVSQLAGKASTADATLTERGFSAWTVNPSSVVVSGETVTLDEPYWDDSGDAPYLGQGWQVYDPFTDLPQFAGNDRDATSITVTLADGTPYTATRTALPGYQLGAQENKPIASEAEAEALRTDKADKPTTSTNNNLAALDANGNLKDSGKTPADFATAEQGGRADAVFGLFEEVPGYDIPAIRLAGFRVPWGVAGYIEFVNGGVHFYHPAAHGEPGVDYTTEWPFKTGKFATTSDIPDVSAKANDSAIAPEFDASASYAVGDVVMHEGARYKCTTAHSGAWAAADFTAESVQEAMDAGGTQVQANWAETDTTSPAYIQNKPTIPSDKPTRIYNETKTDALDDKGQLFDSAEEQSSWTGKILSSGDTLTFTYQGKDPYSANTYIWQSGTSPYWIYYNANTGAISYIYTWSHRSVNIGSADTDINPATGGVLPDIASVNVQVPPLGFNDNVSFSFTPTATRMSSTPYAHLAVETVPTRTIAASTAYAVGDILGDSGKAYRCKSAYTSASSSPTAPSSDATHWTEIPVLAQKADASVIPYDRITITTGQLQDHAVQKVTLNAATTTLSLPALTDLSGKVSDFGIDMVNGYEVSDTPTAASFSLAGTIGTDYNIIVPEGEDWSEMSALAAGEMAQFYFTLSAFAINDKPTWKIVKQKVELYTPATVTP